ncbi:MAG: hypothetical protein ACOYMA_21755 [Bacteroidia bacterium]
MFGNNNQNEFYEKTTSLITPRVEQIKKIFIQKKTFLKRMLVLENKNDNFAALNF